MSGRISDTRNSFFMPGHGALLQPLCQVAAEGSGGTATSRGGRRRTFARWRRDRNKSFRGAPTGRANARPMTGSARTRNPRIPRCAIAHLRSGASAPSRNDRYAVTSSPEGTHSPRAVLPRLPPRSWRWSCNSPRGISTPRAFSPRTDRPE
jgi:hypothetical protein